MKQVVIENPVINSAFKEPSRHFRFTEEGITDEIIESRRISVKMWRDGGDVDVTRTSTRAYEDIHEVLLQK